MAMNKLLNRTKGDKVIWGVVIVLSFISLLAVYSSTGSLAFRMSKNPSYFLMKHLMVLALGLVIISGKLYKVRSYSYHVVPLKFAVTHLYIVFRGYAQ
jgi:cell division protein FtsW (lipid II flippase)